MPLSVIKQHAVRVVFDRLVRLFLQSAAELDMLDTNRARETYIIDDAFCGSEEYNKE